MKRELHIHLPGRRAGKTAARDASRQAEVEATRRQIAVLEKRVDPESKAEVAELRAMLKKLEAGTGDAAPRDRWLIAAEAVELGQKYFREGKSEDQLKDAIHRITQGNASSEDYRTAETAYLDAKAAAANDASSKEELLARAKAAYESALKRASDPSARAEAKEDYEATVKSINAKDAAGPGRWSAQLSSRVNVGKYVKTVEVEAKDRDEAKRKLDEEYPTLTVGMITRV